MLVYVDLVLLLNLLVNYCLLRGTSRLGACAPTGYRLWLGAALGAIYSVAVYLPGMEWLTLPSMKLLSAGGMLLLAYGWKRSTLRLSAIFGVLTLVLCGAVYGTQALGGGPVERGEELFYPVSFSTLLLTAIGVSLACRLLLPRLDFGADSILPLTLELAGREVKLSALRDSGNSLRDPLTGEPVLTVYWKAMDPILPVNLRAADLLSPAELLPRLRELSPRLIPYRAVGTECGMLLALPCRITLGGTTKKGLVALSPTPVSDGGAYEALTGGMMYA